MDLQLAQVYARPAAMSILRQYPDDVDDVLQEAAVKALRFRMDFAGKSEFTTWFSRIVINEALLILRRGARRTFVDIDEEIESEDGSALRWELPSPEPSPEALAIAGEMWNAIEDEVAKMGPGLREEARLLFLGDRLMTDNMRKGRRFRVRKILKARLQREGLV